MGGSLRFRDQTVWITGASSGIGEALAVAFHASGAKLVLSARREHELRRVKAVCGGGDDVRVLAFDLEDIDEIRDRAQEASAQFGTIDMVINNAGISQHAL